MIDFQKLKGRLLFFYYTNVMPQKKQLILAVTLIAIILSTGITLRFITQSNALTYISSANKTLSRDALLASNSTGFNESAKIEKYSPTPVKPTEDPLKTENLQILQRALEATWKKINALQESGEKTILNAQAAEISKLLELGEIDQAKPLIASLIITSEKAESNAILSLTPPPSPTLSPTITPTPTPPYKLDGTSYSAKTISTERGNFSVKVITIDISKHKMVTDTANSSDCSANCSTKSLAVFVKDNNAVAGINGTYFCPPDYAECSSKKNSFDFPVYNSRLKKWINPNNLGWNDRAIIVQDENGIRFSRIPQTVKVYDVYHVGDDWRTGYHRKYYNYDAAFVMTPGLLEDGNVVADQYPLTDKQKTKAVKAGIGFNTDTIFLVIAYNTTMDDFGYVFKALGATNALNLDSGGSTAMWYGNYKVGPGRTLPNAIVFVRK